MRNDERNMVTRNDFSGFSCKLICLAYERDECGRSAEVLAVEKENAEPRASATHVDVLEERVVLQVSQCRSHKAIDVLLRVRKCIISCCAATPARRTKPWADLGAFETAKDDE